MTAAVAEAPHLVHSVPGRVRIHWPGPLERQQRTVEAQLRQLPGVRRVEANPLTGNILILYNLAATDESALVDAVRSLTTSQPTPAAPDRPPATTGPLPEEEPARLSMVRTRHDHTVRARIAVPGIDRDPHLARHVVQHIQRTHPGVRVRASALTGRVLVEFEQYQESLENLAAEITGLDLPSIPEATPANPLDPGPLIQSASRVAGATAGLVLVGSQWLLGVEGTLEAGAVAQTNAVISILSSFPFVRLGLRRLFGRTVADLLLNLPGIVGLALSNNPLGLAVSGTEAVRVLSEVVARRQAWKRFEARQAGLSSAQPGATIRLESGERAPLGGRVTAGSGNAAGRDGLPMPVAPGTTVPAGARLYGGPFVVELEVADAFEPQPRPAPPTPTLYDRYAMAAAPASLAYALLRGLLTRSFLEALEGLLLFSPRTAVIGMEDANIDASARVLRAGVIVVGTRPERTVRLPDVLLLDGPRVLTDGFEVASAVPLTEGGDVAELLARAAAVAVAAGSPWGSAFRAARDTLASDGAFDGRTATARAAGVSYSVGPVRDWAAVPAADRLRYRGEYLLELRSEREEQPLAFFALRPRVAPRASELVGVCTRRGVALGILAVGDPAAAQAVARRAGVPLLAERDPVAAIRAHQAEGLRVAYVADNADAGEAFADCDLAIGVADARTHLPARADLIAPDLGGVAAIIEAGWRRQQALSGSVGLSAAANIGGLVWGLRGQPDLPAASRLAYLSSLGAMGIDWLFMRGGDRRPSAAAQIVEPHPERWGQQSVASVLRAFEASETGLSSAQVAARLQRLVSPPRRSPLLQGLLTELRSPLTIILTAGAGVSVALGTPSSAVIIAATLAANVGVGAWMERQADQAVEALQRLGTPTARVLRDGELVTVRAPQVVPGDLLLLSTGERVGADARLIAAQGLEVDEAALTGESLPVTKSPEGVPDASRVVLEGSDVTSGSGQAVVVAVGRQTRMGAIAAALAAEEVGQTPLGVRLSEMLRLAVPLSLGAGAIVAGSGVLRGQPLVAQLGLGASTSIAAVPEGLPLLARVGEAAVARRLSSREALVRHLSSVEALGRVDVACTDKTGTLTRGHLALSLVADLEREARLPGDLPADLRHVLLAAALASPRPDAPGATSHPTDVAIIQAAESARLGDALRADRPAESPFDPARAFHATLAEGRLWVKGAPEGLADRCAWVRSGDGDQPLDEVTRQELLDRAQGLAARGLRVLLVAEGSPDTPPDAPKHLTVLGFAGISDPLRPSVPAAVRRCHDAGVRVIMLTGDHPATARAIAREAGLLDGPDAADDQRVLTGPEIAELQNGELDARLERATVIARATPLDKLRIVESLQRHRHTVAMTGDGVNDAPALRLADVGVAMGRVGTEVARQTADLVIADDDFATLVEALVEGRSFWRNIRRALGLLLGGNLGEMGLLVGASLLGLADPLSATQILVVNMITDILPSLAVGLQPPETHNLAALAREGTSALDAPLRADVMKRAAATAAPSFAAFGLALRLGTLPQARTVAFMSLVSTQLAQTLDAGWSEGGYTRPVVAAVFGSAGLLGTSLLVPPLRAFLGLGMPTPLGWALVGGGAVLAVLLSRALPTPGVVGAGLPLDRLVPRGAGRLAAPPVLHLLPEPSTQE
jgi:calcium-translocating P-type ATPase